MKKPHVTPTNNERTFLVEELFFSTTDSRGVITAGNDIFERVSGWSFDELIGSPHNIIRHPDMPRAVFHLLWDYLKNGKTIGAYVKNMAHDGGYYWVFALASPIPDGYLSVRFKPTSALLQTVSSLYLNMRRAEETVSQEGGGKNEEIKASVAVLASALNSLGFKDYDEFMSTAICAELASRDSKMKADDVDDHQTLGSKIYLDPRTSAGQILERSKNVYGQVLELYSGLGDFSALRENLEQNANFSEELTKTVRLISLNIAVESARLGDFGRTLAVIATHMDSSSVRIGEASNAMRGVVTEAVGRVRQVMFHLAATRVQLEMVLRFCTQIASHNNDVYRRGRTLEQCIGDLQFGFSKTFLNAVSELKRIHRELTSLDRASEDLRKAVLMLRFAELGGNVESSRLENTGSLALMFKNVRDKIDAATLQLAELCKSARSVVPHIERGQKMAELID